MVQLTFKGNPIRIVDENGIISYVQQVTENSHEPNYDEVLNAMK